MIKIKFCGITKVEDFKKAEDLGADYVGFIFYPKSKRYITPENAKSVLSQKSTSLKVVGVFVNETPEEIKSIFETVPLDLIQYHGDENQEIIDKASLPYWNVLKVKDSNSFSNTGLRLSEKLLIDTFHAEKIGGSGETFNWELIPEYMFLQHEIILAGGLNIDNIEEAIKYPIFGVDLNSGVESSPGIKDHKKMEAIVAKIRTLQ